MKSTAIAITITAVSWHSAMAAGFEVLMPHRAVYEVSLVDAEDRSGIDAMQGRIVYEISGNSCEGMSIKYRFRTRIQAGRDTFFTDQQSASHESPDGREFSFSTKSFVNEQADQDISGSAVLEDGQIKVNLAGKEPRSLELQAGLFVSSHLLEVLKSAENGEAFVTHMVFDGSGEADKVLNSATVIGKDKRVSAKFKGEGGADLPSLLEARAWPVTMSYFNATADNSAEGLPIYEASFLLYGNGVTRDLTMRYPDYELKAVLSKLDYLDAGECD